jgi:hypothetical protein
VSPEIVARPSPGEASVARFLGEAQRFRPDSFMDLLEASLAL